LGAREGARTKKNYRRGRLTPTPPSALFSVKSHMNDVSRAENFRMVDIEINA